MTARVDGEDVAITCRTRDVSGTGLFLDTPVVFPVGTRVTLALVDPDRGEVIELEGKVARAVAGAGGAPVGLGIRILNAPIPDEWLGLLQRAQRPGSESERPPRRLRVLVVADDERRRGAVALYVTSGWDVRFATDLRGAKEALHAMRLDAVIAEHELHDPRWYELLEFARLTQPHARRLVRASLAGDSAPADGEAGDLVHRVVDLHAGLDALLDALSADLGT